MRMDCRTSKRFRPPTASSTPGCHSAPRSGLYALGMRNIAAISVAAGGGAN